MLVRDLIESLNKLPPDKHVVLTDPGCGCCSGSPQVTDEPFETTTRCMINGHTKQHDVVMIPS